MNSTTEHSYAATPRHEFGGGFEREVLPLAADLYRCALSYTRNKDDAEDLVQETMLKAFKAFGRLHEESFMRAWLMCIMRNTWITKCRAESRRRESLVADVSEEALGFAFRNPAGDVLSAECQALFHVMNAEMVAALSALSPVLRKTLYYVAIEGMTGVQAADVMGIPEGTVASRMHRIRRHLRRSAIVTGQQPETTRTFRRAARSPQTVTEQAATG